MRWPPADCLLGHALLADSLADGLVTLGVRSSEVTKGPCISTPNQLQEGGDDA